MTTHRRRIFPAVRLAAALASLLGAAGVPGPVSRRVEASPGSASNPAGGASAECGADNLLAGKLPWQQRNITGDAPLPTDGIVVPEGAIWDGPSGVRLEGEGASLAYDLGAVRAVGAVYLQADANDVYRVTGSVDGKPGTFQLVAELPNVVDRGPGMRNRAIQLGQPARVRYLRVGPAGGDGFYSISEFAAYCRPPTPFPPVLPQVAAPLAAPPPPPAPAGKTPPPEPSNRPNLVLVVAAAVLLLLGAASLKRSPSSSTAEPASSSFSTHAVLRLVFVASGCAALIYEIVWFHLLRLVIGASALSVGLVLAAFMGGMFLGSLLFARFVPRDRNPLRVYAFLEIGIGVFGLLMPVLLPAVRLIYVGLVGYGPLGIALRGLIAAVLLLPPTALMGATLPAVARRYSHGRRGMSGLASLYAANTGGAVLGCLLSGFYLLAVWDVWVATVAAVVLNVVAGLAALRLSRREPVGVDVSLVPAARPLGPALLAARSVYLAVGLSGMTALAAQVVWTRLLTLLFGATVYAFSIILAVFLAGLGLGSAGAAAALRRGANPTRGLAWTQLGIVPAGLLAAALLAEVLPVTSPPASVPVQALHAFHVLRAVAVVLPGAILWGASFPFALAAAARVAGGDTGRSSGLVYAANTLGAILGALLVSFWVIPAFGTRVAQQALVLVAGLSAAALLFTTRRASAQAGDAPSSSSSRLPGAWALAAGVLAAAVLPGPSAAFLAHGRYIWWMDARDQYPYVTEGAASTVAVHVGPDGYRNFHVSGRVEATNNPNDMRLQVMLGHLSALAHPKPESVLVVGLGAGVTAGALAQHPEVKRLVICEIEPRVAGAAKTFAVENRGVLTDPKVEIVFDDARHFLATTREQFDVITSDPIHPWVRGNSVLFSREYYQVVRSRLKPGGLATQWVPLYETTEEAIQMQMKTFMDAFPDGTVWNSAANMRGYDVVMLGRTAPLHMDFSEMQARMDRTPAVAAALRDIRMPSALDLLATYGAGARDMQGWFAQTPLNRDFSLKLEYISGMALNAREADDIYAHMTAARTYPQGVFVVPTHLEPELRHRIGGAARLPR